MSQRITFGYVSTNNEFFINRVALCNFASRAYKYRSDQRGTRQRGMKEGNKSYIFDERRLEIPVTKSKYNTRVSELT